MKRSSGQDEAQYGGAAGNPRSQGRLRPTARLAAALAVALLLSGCGGRPTHRVRGTVQLAEGRPLSAGYVEFESVEEPVSAVGFIQPDGSFELNLNRRGDGAYAGRYRVAVKPPPMPMLTPGQEEEDQRQIEARNQWLAAVDAKYMDAATSGIELTVSPRASENRFDITLE